MAVYAIGDIQGCFDELLKLLELINFNDKHDQLWFVGDLVNRGEKSLETLRFVKSLGENAITVLGNHDIHLLASVCFPERIKKKDTMQAIYHAEDRDELLTWLRQQPLFHYDDTLKMGLLHAGLPPQWDLAKTKKMAILAQNMLKSDSYQELLGQLYSNQPDIWSKNLKDIDLYRFIINCFTRMRYCDKHGRLDFDYKGELNSQPKYLQPWFSLPKRKTAQITLIFGHWSTLGYFEGYNCYAIDAGCVWGRELVALRLDSPNHVQKFSVPSLKQPIF
jgi:bis(5'-nucleosyl)-tetraphosphatase (symmetrical)